MKGPSAVRVRPLAAVFALFQRRWLDPFLVGLLLFTWLKVAWAADDAVSYFGSVEVGYAGYGPVYNPGWRVQAFTSPLWYVALVWGRAFLPDVYLVAQVLSLLLSAGLWVALRPWMQRPALRTFSALAFTASIGFFDYTSSGLETPLVYALLVALLWAWEKRQTHPWAVPVVWAWLALARYDVACTLAGPVLLVHLYQRARQTPLRLFLGKTLLAFAPLLAWTAFATVYYGTPLPNPAYAKLNIGIPRLDLLRQGWLYYLAHLQLDPWTLLVALAGIHLWMVQPAGRPWAAGLALHLGYVAWVGGDFMLGRFLGPAFLVAWVGALKSGRLTPKRAWWSVLGLLVYALNASHTPLTSPLFHTVPWQTTDGVIDERGRYHAASSLVAYLAYHAQGKPYPFFPVYGWSRQGYAVRYSPLKVAVVDSIGMFGYWAGVEKTVVDTWALVDPFLARLPDADGRIWRPGHYERDIPKGYIPTLVTGENRLQDPALSALWEKVALVTRGPLWTWERWKAIPGYILGR